MMEANETERSADSSSGRNLKRVEATTTTTTGDEGSDDDDDDDDGGSNSASGADLGRTEDNSKTEECSGQPEKVTDIRREKRLAMNRESARNRRKRKHSLLRSLEDQVADLQKSNQEYRITNDSLSSSVRTLENELTIARMTITRLSSRNSALINLPQEHGASNIRVHYPHNQLQSSHQQYEPQQRQNVFDSMLLDPSARNPLSLTTTGSTLPRNETNFSNTSTTYAAFNPDTSLRSLAEQAGDITGSSGIGRSTTASSTGLISAVNNSSLGAGDNLSRLLQAHQQRFSSQVGTTMERIGGGAMLPPATVAATIFTPPMDTSTPMNDSLFRSRSLGVPIPDRTTLPAMSMQNFEANTSARDNLAAISQAQSTKPSFSTLGFESQHDLGGLESTFPTPIVYSGMSDITHSTYATGLSMDEEAVKRGYAYQQQNLDDFIRQQNIEDFIRYRNGKDQNHLTQQQPQQPLQFQIQQQQMQLRMLQQNAQQQQQQDERQQLNLQQQRQSQSDIEQSQKRDSG